MNIDEYEVYARERRLKSKIACCLDKCMKEDVRKHGYLTQLINGGITSDSFGNPYMYECTIGDGYEEEGKRWTTSNMYHIYFYSGCRGCTIYKSLKRSIHEKCFVCGESPEPFGKNFFSAGCRVYEDLEKDEVIKMLVNKDWTTFYNVSNNKNKTNYMFLKEMKKRSSLLPYSFSPFLSFSSFFCFFVSIIVICYYDFILTYFVLYVNNFLFFYSDSVSIFSHAFRKT